MAYKKQNFVDGEVLTAAHLNHIEDGISELENTIDSLPSGGTGGTGGTGKDGEDGGYYVPSVNSAGTLTWKASKSEMPYVPSANIKGQKGDQGEPGTPGEKGDPGRGIVSTVRTSGTGAAGTTDIYTITYTDDTTSTFTVYNGANGKDGENGTGGTGGTGADGEDGATFTPYVDANGNLSWSNDKGLANPVTVNIKGEKGDKGDTGDTGASGKDGTSVTHSWNGTKLTVTSASGTSSADLKGEKGDKGDTGEAGKDGKDAVSVTHSWNGTTLSVTSSSGTSSANLKGEKGEKGESGADGDDGFSPTVTISEIDGGHKVQITDKSGTKSFDVMDAPSEIITATSSNGTDYTATVPSITTLTPGVNFIMIPSMASASTAPKLNVNNLGAKTIRQPLTTNTTATAPGASNNWLAVNKPVRVMYDGTYWKTVEIPRPSATGLYGTVPVANGGVPSCTTSDNGKFLRVVEGVATWSTITNAEGVAF